MRKAPETLLVQHVTFGTEYPSVERTLGVPLACYPRLLNGTPAQREQWELEGAGRGTHPKRLEAIF